MKNNKKVGNRGFRFVLIGATGAFVVFSLIAFDVFATDWKYEGAASERTQLIETDDPELLRMVGIGLADYLDSRRHVDKLRSEGYLVALALGFASAGIAAFGALLMKPAIDES